MLRRGMHGEPGHRPTPLRPTSQSVTTTREVRAGRYTDVWARRGNRWACVAANVTRL